MWSIVARGVNFGMAVALMSETRSFAHESNFATLSKDRGGALGQHEDGGFEYLIRKIGAYGHLEKIQFFCKIRSKTLQNVTCELERHHLEVVAPE